MQSTRYDVGARMPRASRHIVRTSEQCARYELIAPWFGAQQQFDERLIRSLQVRPSVYRVTIIFGIPSRRVDRAGQRTDLDGVRPYATGAPVESIFGNFPGKTGEIVAKRTADLIGRGPYLDMKLSFDAIVRLYRGAANDAERKVWPNLGAQFADHNMEAWQASGLVVQHFIVEQISGICPEDRKELAGLILPMLAKVLSYEITGTRGGGFRTVVFGIATVPRAKPCTSFVPTPSTSSSRCSTQLPTRRSDPPYSPRSGSRRPRP
jgi:hypothetical protein